MKLFSNKILGILVILLFQTTFNNAQNWLQVKQGSSISYLKSNDIALDSLENIYIVGMLTGDSYFDSDSLHCQTDGDYFIAKYNSYGILLWTKIGAGISAIDGEQTGALSIALGGVNEIFITGAYCGTINFDTITLTSRGENDIFIINMDSSGNINWAKSAGGSGSDGGIAIEVDEENSIYVTGNIGTYLTNVYFETDTIPMTTTFTLGKSFIAKYDALGNFIWVKTSTGPGRNTGNCLICYKSFVYLTGSFDSLCSFDTINLISSGFNDMYILKYDSSGNIVWGVTAGGPSSDDGMGISIDSTGNCYVVGVFQDSILFDTTVLDCSGAYDGFIAKYSNNGNFIWAKQLQSSQHSIAYSITTDIQGSSYICGEFKGSVLFGNFTLNSAPYHDMFVAKYDSSGSCVGVRQVINSSGSSITTDLNGLSYTTGGFVDTAIFDSYTLYANQFMGNIFWAKLDAITGIEDDERRALSNLIIYANPNQGKCKINVPNEFLNDKHLILTIFDLNGKVIQDGSLKMDEDKIQINLEAEAKGIYNVILSNGKKSYSGKIIFE